jgi:hypothetical protein
MAGDNIINFFYIKIIIMPQLWPKQKKKLVLLIKASITVKN